MSITEEVKARLRSQISRAQPVLFIGAGFSVEASDITGQKIPDSRQLTEELWMITFPGEKCDTGTRLGDAFFAAKQHSSGRTLEFIRSRLAVDARTTPDFYKTWFSLPWVKCYSLNIDDVEQATIRKFELQRGIISISATSGEPKGIQRSNDLEVVHLNGAVWDKLDDMTFSALDYGGRLASPDPWWTACVADIMSRPVVFVGTELDESPLWQYVQYRLRKGTRGARELRPGSYLVCPNLNRARQKILKELNIDWVSMTAQEFAKSVLADLKSESELGHKELRIQFDTDKRQSLPQLISDLMSRSSPTRTEYLMGEEPTWADLQSGRAIEREADKGIYDIAQKILSSKEQSAPLLVTGTAGSGKSTSLMRLGLKLTAEGVPTYWVDEKSNFEIVRLSELVTNSQGPLAILVDDADLWGYLISDWARELPNIRAGVLFGCAIRSTKIEIFLGPVVMKNIKPFEVVMPHLTDGDIEYLIEALDKENRLGVLKGKSHEERVEAFRKEAGRQLLVAMIQATSGKRFEEKAYEEFRELSPLPKQLYAAICLVSSQRFTMEREELLLACGRSDNETLNELENLVRRNVVFSQDKLSGYRARHRVIADVIVNAPEYRAMMEPVLEGVCFAFASRINSTSPRSTRSWRRLIRFLNHEFILQLISPEDGRRVYERLESILNWDYHYWLQRGGLEVQEGKLDLAENFLGQSRSLAQGNDIVETEWAYLMMKKAARFPEHASAHEWFREGHDILLKQIEIRGNFDPYPYHVLGSQTLAWVRAASLPKVEKRELLHMALEIVRSGKNKHHTRTELSELEIALNAEWLMTAVD